MKSQSPGIVLRFTLTSFPPTASEIVPIRLCIIEQMGHETRNEIGSMLVKTGTYDIESIAGYWQLVEISLPVLLVFQAVRCGRRSYRSV